MGAMDEKQKNNAIKALREIIKRLQSEDVYNVSSVLEIDLEAFPDSDTGVMLRRPTGLNKLTIEYYIKNG